MGSESLIRTKYAINPPMRIGGVTRFAYWLTGP
jgi:hypothetical protein